MTSHMAEVAKLLGVELRETFNVINTNSRTKEKRRFRLTKKGVECSWDGINWIGSTDPFTLEKLITGENVVANRPWKPTFREIYYVPSILNRDLYDFNSWNNDEYDKELYRRRVVFKTKEEAINMTGKLLALTKKHRLFHKVSD